ncbi:MAG: guanylate kinase [Firmicutes bacterium]|nr:guanylate kinase [Bacillota bacterium]
MNHECNHPGELFIISGPSGAGKGTICKYLLEDATNMVLSVSATTRAPREGEVHGESYFFIDKETFITRIEEGGFLEYAEVFDNYYGTPKENVVEKLEQGIDVVLEIDIQGAKKVKETYPEGIFIFILPPSLKELRRRLIGRGTDSMEVIEKRLAKSLDEIREIHSYDYFVINDDLDIAVAEVEAIVTAEHDRVVDHGDELVKMFEEEKEKEGEEE